MSEGEAGTGQGVRVRLDGNASRADVAALKAWLEREKPLERLVRAGELTIVERQRDDAPQGHMGAGMEILLALVSSAATVGFRELLEQTKRAVAAWRANRGQVESGETPEAAIDPVDLDER